MSVPVGRLEKGEQYRGASENGVKREPLDEAVQRPRATVGEVRAESVAADVFHLVLLRERRDGACWVLLKEGFVEVEEVREASTDREI